MLNEEFLNELLGNEEVSAEDKIKQIISEHEADTRGLLAKRDELLGSEKKLKEKISAYETAKGEYETKITGLEEELKKATSEDHKKYYENQLAELQNKHAEELAKITTDRDLYKGEYLKAQRNAAIEEGIKDLNFVPGLKEGFIARVLSLNEFTPDTIDGTTKFLNKEHHTIEEAIHAFALTQEGKAYIANPSTGGGARGSSSTVISGSGNKNPFKKETENLTEQMRLYKEDRAAYDRLRTEAGL